jgi:hypothetical protein
MTDDDRTLVDAVDAVAYQLKMLGNGGAQTSMGAIEAFGRLVNEAVVPAVLEIAAALREVAKAIDRTRA